MIEYGTVVKKTQYQAGREINVMTTFTQSVKVSSNEDVIQMFEELLNKRSQGELHNPGISIEEYTDTGDIKRIIKSWSVYE